MIERYPGALWVGSPYHGSRDGIAPEAVVLHIAEGTLHGVDSWFNSLNASVSAHFCVGKDGSVHQYVELGRAAWANGVVEPGAPAALVAENAGINPNKWTVAIEHEGYHYETPTDAQIEASERLTAWLFKEVLLPGSATGVALDRKHILRHADISPVTRKNCPGWSEGILGDYIADTQELLAPTFDPRIIQARDLLNAVIEGL